MLLLRAALLVLALITLVGPARAEINSSEFYYRPPTGIQAYTIGGAYIYSKLTGVYDDGTSADRSTNSYGLGMLYAYGITDRLVLEVSDTYSFAYTWHATKPGTNSTGLENPGLNIKASIPMKHGSFKYGLQFSISPAPSFSDRNQDSNNYTGGSSVSPYIGYERYFEDNVAGFKILQQVLLGTRTLNTITENSSGVPTANTTSEVDGGETTQYFVFFEHLIRQLRIGFEFYVTTTQNTTSNVSGNAHSISPNWTLKLYTPYRLGPKTDDPYLLPSFTYTTSTGNASGPDIAADLINVNSYDVYNLTLSYRLTF